MLQAEGYSYAEIAETCGWTYTKVNRSLAEGRARLRSALGRRVTSGSGAAYARRLPRNRASLVLSALLLALAVAVPAQAKPRKPPKYKATIEVTTHTRVFIACDYGWTADWVFTGTYTPTTINSLATLDAVSRTGSGTLAWSERPELSARVATSGSCPLGVESPIPGAGRLRGRLRPQDARAATGSSSRATSR